ncbi:hypothetical protein, partial [Burkholderia ubonensis]|uniref:hypothetical protein n=1 Tax=Burkholderia ubonensis TaxID=101571 RepID=UPI001E2F357C
GSKLSRPRTPLHNSGPLEGEKPREAQYNEGAGPREWSDPRLFGQKWSVDIRTSITDNIRKFFSRQRATLTRRAPKKDAKNDLLLALQD